MSHKKLIGKIITTYYLCCDNNKIAYKELENGSWTTICLTCGTNLGTEENPLIESYITKSLQYREF